MRGRTWIGRLALVVTALVAVPGCRERSQPPAGGRGAPAVPAGATASSPRPWPATPAADAAPAPRTSAAPRREARAYRLTGIVTDVDRAAGEVDIRHDAIPGYMPAMTMPFALEDKELLRSLRPGDRVEGALRVGPNRSELSDLRVTAAAAGQELAIAPTGGSAGLRPRRGVLEPGEEVPDFAMTTQEGEALRLSDLRGKVVVLTFVYTRCPLPDFCPLMDRKFAELSNKISAVPGRAEHVRLLSVSFDPEHDTPAVLRRHARLQGARPPLWTFAVAAHEELRKVAEPLGLRYGPAGEEIIHNLSTAVIDRRGRLVRLARGAEGRRWSPLDFFKTIYSLFPDFPR